MSSNFSHSTCSPSHMLQASKEIIESVLGHKLIFIETPDGTESEEALSNYIGKRVIMAVVLLCFQ